MLVTNRAFLTGQFSSFHNISSRPKLETARVFAMGEDKDFVTLKPVNSLLEAQVSPFKSAFQMMFQDVKEELKAIKTDIGDLKNSAQFSMGQIGDLQEKVKSIEKKVNSKKQI